MLKELKEIDDEIHNFIEKIKLATQNDAEITIRLKGWKIFYSPKIQNADILLIGINPGSGELDSAFKYHNENYKIIEYLIEDRNKYKLARDTFSIFEKMNRLEMLEKRTAKINSRFYATTSVNSMIEFESILELNYSELYGELMSNSKRWLLKVIELVNPKIIVCEGFSAFSFLDNEIYPEGEDWEYSLQSDYNVFKSYKRKSDGLILFGYTRSYKYLDTEKISQELHRLLTLNGL